MTPKSYHLLSDAFLTSPRLDHSFFCVPQYMPFYLLHSLETIDHIMLQGFVCRLVQLHKYSGHLRVRSMAYGSYVCSLRSQSSWEVLSECL